MVMMFFYKSTDTIELILQKFDSLLYSQYNIYNQLYYELFLIFLTITINFVIHYLYRKANSFIIFYKILILWLSYKIA